jgi:hypothetical protein
MYSKLLNKWIKNSGHISNWLEHSISKFLVFIGGTVAVVFGYKITKVKTFPNFCFLTIFKAWFLLKTKNLLLSCLVLSLTFTLKGSSRYVYIFAAR